MPQNEVVTLPRQNVSMHRMEDIEKLAEAVAKSRMFGITTKEQALVLMAISQAEGRHPAEAARDYNIIQGKPAKTSEAMMRDFIHAGGRVEWHALSDDVADATFAHPQGGTIRIVWDTARAAKAGLASKDMWKKFPRQMMRSRCVSEGVRTVCPMATSSMYVPEEVRDMPTMALPEASTDTTEALNQFAAVTGDAEPPEEWNPVAEVRIACERGAEAFRAFWRPLSDVDRERIKLHYGSDLEELKAIAKQADDPFGLPPLDHDPRGPRLPREGMPSPPEQPQTDPHIAQPAAGPAPAPIPSDAGQPFAEGDVFSQRDHEARAATKDGLVAWRKWSKTLSRDDRDLILPLFPEYEQLARDADAQRGLAL